MTIDDMWERLAQHQPYADQRGYGEAWAKMCEARTQGAAWAASEAASAAAARAAAWAARAARAAEESEEAEAVEWVEKAEGEK